MNTQPRTDVYSRVTSKIIVELEQGVRTWQKPWNAEHAAGRITRPLRANGQGPSWRQWPVAVERSLDKGYNAPLWMTYKQATKLGAQVRKG